MGEVEGFPSPPKIFYTLETLNLKKIGYGIQLPPPQVPQEVSRERPTSLI